MKKPTPGPEKSTAVLQGAAGVAMTTGLEGPSLQFKVYLLFL